MLTKTVTITTQNAILLGELVTPDRAQGIVIFVHGSGSSRLSPRNKFVANKLNEDNFATLLFDLLTSDEERIDNITAELRFNIPLLAIRLNEVTDWVNEQSSLQDLPIGYFGASTGAAAALSTAAIREDVKAVVSRGGRPDLAGEENLSKVTAATLLIVGGLDDIVITLNEKAQKYLTSKNKLEIVPGATHLFEEPGTLDEVTKLATQWFKLFLV